MTELTILDSLQQSEGFFVRVNEHEGYEEKLKLLEEHPDYIRLLAVRHVGKFKENRHFHFAVNTVPELKPQTFRVRMKTIFDAGKGNAHMSIKPWDGSEKALSYMFHETPVDLITQYGHSDDDVARYIAFDADVKKAYKRTGCSSSTQFLTQSVIETFDDMVNKYKQGDHNPDSFESINTIRLDNGYPNRKDIAFLIWDTCKERKINFPSKFNLKTACDKVQAHYARGTANWYQLKNEWYDEFFN